MDNLSDEELVRIFISGDRAVFELIFKRYYRRVYSLCLRFCNLDTNLAEEAAQETFLQTYKSLDRFQFKSGFYTWLYRVTFNTCSIAIKKASRNRAASIDSMVDVLAAPVESSPGGQLARKEHHNQVATVLKELPDDQKKVMILGPVMGHSYQEIAEIIGETITVVKGRLFRARQNFKKKFEKYDDMDNSPKTIVTNINADEEGSGDVGD
jgi:RNA polymerase sigma-70 factor (ECF subfamily)